MASFIPEDIIHEIRHQADIVAVISEYVSLEQAGQNYKGLCPFHQEKTPSFVVSPAKQIYHCYGCGAGGNVFTFLMRHEKYTFPEAVYTLARRLGIRIPSEKNAPQATPQLKRSEMLYQLHRDAARFFAQQLAQSQQAKSVREYLHQRGIDEKMCETFSLGYALPAWDGLRNRFIQKYPVEILLESGLLIKRKDGGGQYDRFRDRLIIPIHDIRGRVIAFGGRILSGEGPKYLNSPESAIFQKGKTLFGMYHAKEAIRKTESVLIVEGYFDMIIPYSRGIRQIAATMGTAVTPQHLQQLQRYTKKVILVFDSDPAGINAVLRTLDMFVVSGFDARAVVLPQGEDPDSFVRKEGVESFQAYIDHAPSLLDFIRDRMIERCDISQIEGQIGCANQLLPTIVKIQNIIERNAQISRTADLLHITDESLLQQFKKVMQTGQPRLDKISTSVPATIPVLEQYLVKALMKDKSLIAGVREELKIEELSHPIVRQVLHELFVYGDKTDFEARILDLFQGREGQEELTRLFMHIDEVVDPVNTVRDCIVRLRQKRFDHATLDVSQKVRDAQEKNHRDSLEEYLEQKNKDLWKKKRHLL